MCNVEVKQNKIERKASIFTLFPFCSYGLRAMEQAVEPYVAPSLDISNCVTVTLTERNYILWKSQFEAFLSGQGLLGFVTGSIPEPPQTMNVPAINGNVVVQPHPEYSAWNRTDQVVKSWLLGSFSEDILSVVVSCRTSLEVWMTLANHFNRVSSSRLFELQRKIQTFIMKDKPMSEYLKEIKGICDQLASIGSPVTEKMKIFAALHGLGREYEPIKTSIEGSIDAVPSPTFEDDIPKLISYEDRLKSYSSYLTVSPHLAFNVTKNQENFEYPQQGYYRNNNRGRGYNNNRYNYSRSRGSYSTRVEDSINRSRLVHLGLMEVRAQLCVRFVGNQVILLSNVGTDSTIAINMRSCLLLLRP